MNFISNPLKYLLALITFATCVTTQALTLEELKASFKKAYLNNDKDLYWSLVYRGGLPDSPEIKEKYTKYFGWREDYGKPNVTAVELAPLRGDENNFSASNGIKYESNLKILGYLKLNYSFEGKSTSGSSLKGYGKVADNYYFAGIKETKLDWKGPKDTRLFYKIKVDSDSDILKQVKISWNASGIDMTRTRGLRNGIMGQHINRIDLATAFPYKSLKVEIHAVQDGEKKLLFEKTYTGNETLIYERLNQ